MEWLVGRHEYGVIFFLGSNCSIFILYNCNWNLYCKIWKCFVALNNLIATVVKYTELPISTCRWNTNRYEDISSGWVGGNVTFETWFYYFIVIYFWEKIYFLLIYQFYYFLLFSDLIIKIYFTNITFPFLVILLAPF